ncbi:hypothetical protein SAY87_005793 [Trapa incisa]|uniref:Uncharacterized protein n=1 Tax=Trapa incisa TaxID=236973 RepID=A0AAN7KD30_9MYRT|nr:hypothetical protein SAY87_005793 [Trapa incisa]
MTAWRLLSHPEEVYAEVATPVTFYSVCPYCYYIFEYDCLKEVYYCRLACTPLQYQMNQGVPNGFNREVEGFACDNKSIDVDVEATVEVPTAEVKVKEEESGTQSLSHSGKLTVLPMMPPPRSQEIVMVMQVRIWSSHSMGVGVDPATGST